ncbi:MAG: hypothetical protein ACOH1V_04920 [Stenotrophomonas sp.]
MTIPNDNLSDLWHRIKDKNNKMHISPPPVTTMLFVDSPTDPLSIYFHIVQVTNGLHGSTWDALFDEMDTRLSIILITHRPPDASDLMRIPRHIPWLITPDSKHALVMLDKCLAAPLRDQGLLRVDYGDFLDILTHGGEISLFEASGLNVNLACEAFEHAISQLKFSLPAPAVSVHIRYPVDNLSTFNNIGNYLLGLCELGNPGSPFGPDTSILMTLAHEDRSNITLSTMIIAGRPEG